jgi:hypothetical protein
MQEDNLAHLMKLATPGQDEKKIPCDFNRRRVDNLSGLLVVVVVLVSSSRNMECRFELLWWCRGLGR